MPAPLRPQPAAGDGRVAHPLGQRRSRRLAHGPIKWNHLIDKNSL